ncbi:type VI secretion system-associated FHA domain protein [Undibacterium arcticum]
MSDQHSFEPNPRADVNNIASQDPAHQELLDAFMRGAGIAQDPAGRGIGSKLTPELMEMLGKLLSVSIRGTHNLLSSRSMVKRAVQADVTVVVKRNNNPLKFFLQDSDTIILQMLRKKMPGFMEPVEAMQEAYGDLYAHQKKRCLPVLAPVCAMRWIAFIHAISAIMCRSQLAWINGSHPGTRPRCGMPTV